MRQSFALGTTSTGHRSSSTPAPASRGLTGGLSTPHHSLPSRRISIERECGAKRETARPPSYLIPISHLYPSFDLGFPLIV
jgi:hypothetical protein